MSDPTAMDYVKLSLDALKDFQKATVDVVYDNLFKNSQQRMLIADEVGLGKTIVAKGIIARRIKDKIDAGDNTPLKVTYICSNQVIAHENVGKLDIYPNQQSHDRFASRLTYLSLEQESDDEGMLRLNTLTPATSFNKGSNTGQQDERKILYTLLMNDESLSQLPTELAIMLRAGVTRDPKQWAKDIEGERDWYKKNLRANCSDHFLDAIRSARIPYKDCYLFQRLGRHESIPVYEAICQFLPLLTCENVDEHRDGSNHLAAELKDILSEVCVEYIDADIYILDEFQRFKALVNQEDKSEAADIAKRIFGKQEARILLLSATPFKAYTGESAWESDEEHYKEFKTILGFLFDKETQCLDEFESHRQLLFKQLLELNADSSNIDTAHRDAVQDVLRRVMCRTERLSVSDDLNAMTIDKWRRQPLQVSSGDIQNFIATDNVVRCLNDTEDNTQPRFHAPVEFCKSAPFPLSFLDDYKLKKHLRKRRTEAAVHKELRANVVAWISHKKVNGYKLSFADNGTSACNAKLIQVINEALDKSGEMLLWVPPSLPCYPLSGVFKESAGFSKTLIFSAWLMVPRMLSSLISYEVERRTIGNRNSMDEQEQKPRRYSHDKMKRHPIPQLVFSQKKTGTDDLANNMSNYALLYPSHTLAEAFDPSEAFLTHRSLDEIRTSLAEKIDTLIVDAGLDRFASSAGESERWYWAAPLLLDRSDSSMRKAVKSWLHSSWRKDSRYSKEGAKKGSSKEKHFDTFTECFEKPGDAGLGPLPDDLAFVLADMAIASPAIAAVRCAKGQFDVDFSERTLFAFEIATEFLSLFNKPESIASVRLSTTGTEKRPYWRRVLAYCADGCLQSVLDEFFHVLKSDCPSIWEMYTRIIDSMNLGTASIKVDDLNSFINDRRKNMRCHYAVDLGNQRVETEDGKKRIKGIRHNFNSPFRPFVLATTSIGQEGLDFHTYCRKIVHWNLPSNPIDLEQREGRINRFKGLVIRQQIAKKYGDQVISECTPSGGVWDTLFELADKAERRDSGKCELIPYWHVEADHFQIERIIPFYPFSKDRAKLASLLKTLALYRLAFGQPRQSELVEHLLTNLNEDRIKEVRSKLMIDLSPIRHTESANE